ncbi:hypothetical protein PC128_g25327, partial [Phytophthora cactorum]
SPTRVFALLVLK